MRPIGIAVAVGLVAALPFLEPGVVAQAPAPPIALAGGTLIDGTSAAPVRDSVVLIRGERIERVGTMTSLPIPDGYERISTEGMTVLPGLVTIPASARQYLTAGATSVRASRRRRASAGEDSRGRPGPRIG